MEWYIDGIPVAELKRRYEAHDALVKALTDIGGFTDENASRYLDDCGSYRLFDEPYSVEVARKALAAAEVRNG